MKNCLNLICLAFSWTQASAGYVALAICYILILVGGIILLVKYRKECQCKCQTELPTTTIRNMERLSSEFNQTTCPQRTAHAYVQPSPPGTAFRLDIHAGEPPPPYPGM